MAVNWGATKPEQMTLQQLQALKQQLSGMGSAGQQFLNDPYFQDVLQTRLDEDVKNTQQRELDTNYGTAMGALTPAKEADVNEFQRTSPLLQRRLLGSLNARGLGASVAAGGAGSGAVSELAAKQQAGLQGIKEGYQGLYNNLEKQKAGDVIDLDSFYRNLAGQRAYSRQLQKQNEPDFFDFAKTGLGVASIFV